VAITPRSSTTVAYGTRTNTTVTAPAGSAVGDVIVVCLDAGGPSAATITPPSGWTQLGTVTYSAPDPWNVVLQMWAKPWATGETSWTWLHSSSSTQAYAVAYQGVDVTAMADVAASTAFAPSGATATAGSITTVTAGAPGVLARGAWDGNAITPPAGWTEVFDVPVLWVAERDWPTPGATGTVAVPTGNGSSGYPWGIIHAALRPSTGGGATNYDVASAPASTVGSSSSATVGKVAGATRALTAGTSASGLVGKVADMDEALPT
jgi:hypothetical protein